MVGLMNYCISISTCGVFFYIFFFCCFGFFVCFLYEKSEKKKLCKMTIIETDCRFYDQTPRHVFIEENGVSYHMGISYLVRH